MAEVTAVAAARKPHERFVGGIALALAFLMLAAITACVIGFGSAIVMSAINSAHEHGKEIAACEQRGAKGVFVPADTASGVRGVTVECHNSLGHRV